MCGAGWQQRIAMAAVSMVTLFPAGECASQELQELPAYHTDWGPGRGFEVGQRVPDIPLFDMQGKERRLGEFLGQPYVLFCWASW